MRNPENYEQDADRIAETLFQVDFKGNIKDKDSFNKAYDNYLNNAFDLRENAKFRNMVFEKFVSEHPSRITEGESFFEKGDLPPEKIERPKIKREFNHIGKVGDRIVFLRKDYINTKYGKRQIYRDRTGQIGKPKNPDV